MSTTEEDYTPLKESCEKMVDFIEEIQEAEEIDDNNKKRLASLQREIVSETSILVNEQIKKKLSVIKQRIDPLVEETNDLIQRVAATYAEPDPHSGKKLFSKRRNKRKLQG